MKILKTFLLITLLALVVSAQGFEGYVKYKMDAAGETTFMKYYKKGEKVRMEPEMDQMQISGAIIFKEGKTYMVMPAQKMYMEFGDEMYDMGKMNDETGNEDDAEMNKPAKTGETKDILGYTAEKWIFNDDEYSTEVWAAKGLGEFVFLSLPMAKEKMPGWYEDVSSGGFFPMLVEAKSKDGSLEGRMEVVEINEEKVSDDKFDIPSDFTKFSMPGGN